jgi:hypothetical protein
MEHAPQAAPATASALRREHRRVPEHRPNLHFAGVRFNFAGVAVHAPEPATIRRAPDTNAGPRPGTGGCECESAGDGYACSGAVHPKLEVGSAEDPLEHEADRLAEQVLGTSGSGGAETTSGGAGTRPATTSVRRTCTLCDEPDAVRQRVHRKGETSRGATPQAPESVRSVLRSPGAALDAAARSFLEPRFGHDFSRVRVHADDAAARSAYDVGAAAYTVGTHIAFGAGRYAPATGPGRKLLAHELAHVVQHDAGARRIRRAPDLDAAVGANDWAKVAEILNGYNADGIKAALAKLKRGQIAGIHAGAIANPKVGPDSAIAQATRAAYLDMNYENELKREDWPAVAKHLNGFSSTDIETRLKTLTDDQVQKIHDGAVANKDVGDKSNVALVSAQVLTARKNAPVVTSPTATPAPTATACPTTFTKAGSFKDLIALVRAAETKLTAKGITTTKDQIHALRGIFYGTAWSLDYSVEKSTTRNEGFQRFTRPSEDPAKTVPPDVRTALDCGLFKALQDSQDIVDPGGRQVDFGHLIIGLDARNDPALTKEVSYPVDVGPLSINIGLGGTGTELVTWLGDLGGGAASLAAKRVDVPATNASTVFTGSDYGGSINLEGDVAASVVATGSSSAVTAPVIAAGKSLSDALEDYLAPAGPGAAWNNRATTFLTMNGAKFDASNTLTNRAALVTAFSKKIQEFACNYLASRVKDSHLTYAKAKAASLHVPPSSEEVAAAFVDALDDSHKTGAKVNATRFPAPGPAGSGACTAQLAAAGVLSP